ncbi:restriction endonuclease subunit S [Cellulosimicrobium sp. TH-20]|uniref:restriction endonuclease subunit S n=1 Tax=Cellulosimicrobium sp. TH-20 TaxID=1980001 RepID=UPI001C92D2A7|nr:restriction endonuclease subunit S [Cellulosimicrobium sp. TH-20]
MTTLPGLGLELPASWGVATLAEVTSKIGSGATPRGGNSVYVASGPALIRSQNIHDHEFKPEGLAFLSQEAAAALRGVTVETGDVLINITGDSILRTAVVPESVLPARVNQHVAIVRSNGRVDPGFLQKWLSLPLMKEYMLGHSSGGTRKAITKGHLQSFPIPLPPLAEQRAIAATLGALDDKIESNRRAAETLGTLIGALFTQTTSGPAISYAPLGEITSVVKGRSYKSAELEESSTALVTLKSIDRNGGYKGDGLKPYTGSYRAEQVVHPGEIVVAQTDLTQGAEVVGRGVRVPQSTRYDTLVASLDLAIVRPERGMPVEYLFGLLSSGAFRQHCRNHVTGTTVLHLAKDAIPTWEAPIVSFAEQVRFAKTARTLLARMDALFEENDRLVALRDSLLPELLSGRIRVPAEGVAA